MQHIRRGQSNKRSFINIVPFVKKYFSLTSLIHHCVRNSIRFVFFYRPILCVTILFRRENFFLFLFSFFIFYEFFKNVINKKKSKKFLHCIALDKCWIVKRGDKISYWHKLKSFVPLSGNLLVLCLLLRPEIDRITSLLAFQIIRTIRDCTFVFFFAVISNFLLWYVYDFPIFLDPKILSVICICFGCYYFKNT